MTRRVSYFYDPNISTFHYASGHPMKPLRVRMTHSLITAYGLYRHMDVHRPCHATFENLTNFHSVDYVNFLQSVTRHNMNEMSSDLQKYNVGEDCPVFQGLYDYCRSTTGGTLSSAYKLNSRRVDIAINWSGGLHHAKRSEASGFCYINDIVIGILELLKYNERVLYIDIDVHHGDGVEEAFYMTDRVYTVSFHKYGDFFPGTGALNDIGEFNGRGYAANVPLKDGINDTSYAYVFKPVMENIINQFRPNIIVLQCGADSLSGDRLGCFNLSNKGHSECVSFVKSFNIPLLILGGGGYTVKNVCRTWTYETSKLLDVEIPEELPYNEFYEHFGPDYSINVRSSNMSDHNSLDSLDNIISTTYENLKKVTPSPSCQMQDIPPELLCEESDDEVVWKKFKNQGSTKLEDTNMDNDSDY